MARRGAAALGAALAAVALAAVIALGAGATPKLGPTKPAPITDANVAEHVLSARTKADNEALAAYYKAKAAAEEPRVEHYDQLFHAYMKLEGRWAEPLQRHARDLLKAARMAKKHYELLAQAHLNQAWGEPGPLPTRAGPKRRDE